MTNRHVESPRRSMGWVVILSEAADKVKDLWFVNEKSFAGGRPLVVDDKPDRDFYQRILATLHINH